MRLHALVSLGMVLVCGAAPATAQPNAEKPKTPLNQARGSDKPTENLDLNAIRKTSIAFTEAFNKGDAAAVSMQWTADGEFVDQNGEVYTGRNAIQKAYEDIFAAHAGEHIKIVIDSLRLLNETAALEDGRVTLDTNLPDAPELGRYSVVHIKVDGKWLMSSVREAQPEIQPASNPIGDLQWLIGTWVAEEHGNKTESVCTWVANKSFVQRTYTVTRVDQSTTSGVQMIGYNPQGECIQSWNFTSDGGVAVGVWTPIDNGWSADVQGTLANGQLTQATNLLVRLDDNAYVWQSLDRSVGDQPLPDTDEVVQKRKVK